MLISYKQEGGTGTCKWSFYDPDKIPNIHWSDVISIRAHSSECVKIKRYIKGIPFLNLLGSCVWVGESAQFIWANLPVILKKVS